MDGACIRASRSVSESPLSVQADLSLHEAKGLPESVREASRLTFYPYQVVVIVLTYINALPIPWRLAIMIHACVQLCGADRRLSGVQLTLRHAYLSSQMHMPALRGWTRLLRPSD